jgi:hypothetical protein
LKGAAGIGITGNVSQLVISISQLICAADSQAQVSPQQQSSTISNENSGTASVATINRSTNTLDVFFILTT